MPRATPWREPRPIARSHRMMSSSAPAATRRHRPTGSPIPWAGRALVAVLLLVVMATQLVGAARGGSCPRQHLADVPGAGHVGSALAAAGLPHDVPGDAAADAVPCGTGLALPATVTIAAGAPTARQARPDGAARLLASHDPPALFRPPRVS